MNAVAKSILVSAGVLLALGTVFGAVGTHALRARLTPDQLGVFETAVRYHFYNALGLLAAALGGSAHRGGHRSVFRGSVRCILRRPALHSCAAAVWRSRADRRLGFVRGGHLANSRMTPLG
jgi:hypothetical protein